MHLRQSIQRTFLQLTDLLEQLTEEQFSRPSKTLFGATIGQHVRHIIELFICLENSYDTGLVNYEKRNRDRRIETDRDFAQDLLFGIANSIRTADKELMLESYTDAESDEAIQISTNYFRELLYNLEHTIHHMALIRVGINEISTIKVPQEFGVAPATIKYKKACVQ
ncbi:MAG: DinB family protein [Flavisolibacter sp.]|nr:DinB family protein [Flavisolibacter sp.]